MRAEKLRNSVLAVFVFAAPLAARGSEMPPLPELKRGATFAIVQRQVNEAYVRARERPTDAAANGKLAMVLDAYEQYDSAALCYRRANALDPKSFEWMYDLGWVEFKQGRYDEAAKALAAALARRPDYLPARLKLADSRLAAGQFEAARKLYAEVVHEDPSSAEAYYGLGRVQAAQRDTRAAVVSLETACRLFAQYGAAHYALALGYRKLGEAKKAHEHFTLYKANVTTVPPAVDPLRAAVQQLDRGPLALVRRGIDLEQAGDLRGAIREHLKALDIDPKDVQARINLIQLYARTGDYEKAGQEYQAAVSLDPNRADCYYNYGVMMFHLRKFPGAEKAFRRAIEINPYNAEAHNNLGALLQMQGKLDDALAEFEKAARDRPDYRLPHFQIGRVLANQEKYPEAIQEFLKTLKPEDEDKDTARYLYALGATYGRAGDFGNALRYLREARDQASTRGQSGLLTSINRDLETLEQQSKAH